MIISGMALLYLTKVGIEHGTVYLCKPKRSKYLQLWTTRLKTACFNHEHINSAPKFFFEFLAILVYLQEVYADCQECF